jgi:phosphatidate cytidylyltransferase
MSNLTTRILIGALLILLTTAMLVVDPAPGYPLLILLVHFIGLVAVAELRSLLPESTRPPGWLAHASVQGVLLANWPAHLVPGWSGPDPWQMILGAFVAVVLGALLFEMAMFREPGSAVNRSALLIWMTAYLGLLPCFLAQQRWLRPGSRDGAVFLALTIFIPKCCDIGAYFTGRFLGRHPMSPVISPKKTWEGFAGGLALAVGVTLLLHRFMPVLPCYLSAVGFGVTVGVAGVLGDLAESLVKRDTGHKDASRAVPGFGGVLDVVDSLLFAAPVAYCWFVVQSG